MGVSLGGKLTVRASGALAYVAGGIGFRSRSNIELLLKLASVGWAFLAGGFGLLLGMMDYGPGVAAMFAFYAGSGFVFGLLNPAYWKLAPACAWAGVLIGTCMAVISLPLVALSVVGLIGLDYERELWRLATMVVLPVAGALLGAFVGMRIRTSIAPRAIRALGREKD
jgi:FtsH-binding integral membrane protein